MQVEKWRKTVNQASPAFAISRRTAARKRSSAEADWRILFIVISGKTTKDVIGKVQCGPAEWRFAQALI